MELKSKIREIQDWPISGVNFKDITTILEDHQVFAYTIDAIVERFANSPCDKIVGIDARGFLFASTVAYKMKKGLVIVRKKGKLPPTTIQKKYTLEYGTNVIEMKDDAIKQGEKVIIVDDLCASGGTILATCDLIEQMGGQIVGVCFLIDLPFLRGSKKLGERGYEVHSLVEYEAE